MPDPYSRHSRPNGCCESWVTQPPRSQLRQLAAAEDTSGVKRAPGRKNRDLCKAAHWKGPHQPAFQLRQFGHSRPKCKWGISWLDPGKPTWMCCHEETCAGCGRILRDRVPADECPDFRPITRAEQSTIEAEIERRKQVVPWRRQRPVITGPQGYRRKRTA